jgi:hypothetical protein
MGGGPNGSPAVAPTPQFTRCSRDQPLRVPAAAAAIAAPATAAANAAPAAAAALANAC